ncbi:FlhC family transcriptional regulator [Geoalkalibacter subterraneus]|uniref:Flagellar transcriptional regulator FlhC n=1 Tax=Geoalkalibacter subterraneus TaxID=483547 RepID=A0A0B5FU36_9BACT|nr:FlhC family transcriptional regulator [Geoalkalibacter subterraneus]AJF08179.1 hypothetical protein GSUB_16925 [Geoalkalibacter subterraneus]
MKVSQIVKDISVWQVAEQMIVRGARPPIVIASTNLPRDAVRDMYYSIHGKRPPSGLLPDSSLNVIKKVIHASQATIFYHCYRKVAEADIFKTSPARDVLRGFDFYQKVCGAGCTESIDFSVAWFIARDLRTRNIETKYCPKCGMDYLFSLTNSLLHSCPFCKNLGDKNKKNRAE